MAYAKEKRKHPRTPARLPLKFRLLRGGPPKILQAQSLDLSKGGMSFRSPDFIPHRSSVQVEFSPPGCRQPVRVASEVVRTRELYGGDHFVIGVKFQHMLK